MHCMYVWTWINMNINLLLWWINISECLFFFQYFLFPFLVSMSGLIVKIATRIIWKPFALCNQSITIVVLFNFFINIHTYFLFIYFFPNHSRPYTVRYGLQQVHRNIALAEGSWVFEKQILYYCSNHSSIIYLKTD